MDKRFEMFSEMEKDIFIDDRDYKKKCDILGTYKPKLYKDYDTGKNVCEFSKVYSVINVNRDTLVIPDKTDIVRGFQYEKGIKNVQVDGNGIVFDSKVFIGSDIETLKLMGSIEAIKDSAFYDCKRLSSKVSLHRVRIIENNAFGDNEKLTDIKLGGRTEFIGFSAFASSGLKEIEWVGSVGKVELEITEQAFYSTMITEFKPMNTVNIKRMGDGVLYSCSELTKVEIETLEEIGQYAFAHCVNLTDIILPNLIKADHCLVWGCNNIKRMYVPKLKEIKTYTFDRCSIEHLIISKYAKEVMDKCNFNIKKIEYI